MTKDQFLDAWEGPCVEAAQEALEVADKDDVTLDVAFRAIASKLMEGLEGYQHSIPKYEKVRGKVRYVGMEPDPVQYWRLTLPKEQSE